MIKIERIDLDLIAEEYYQYLQTWLFDNGHFATMEATYSAKIVDAVQTRCYAHLCYRMKKALKNRYFVLAQPDKQKTWMNKIVKNSHKEEFFKQFSVLMTELYNGFFQANVGKREMTIGYWLVKRLKIRVCPYCNRNYTFSVAKTKSPKVRAQFDHFIPKKKYPMVALCFYNLVPSCPICNKLKGEHLVTFNPYQEGFPVNQKFVLSKGEKDLSWIRPTSELKISISNSDDNQNKKQFLLEELYQQHADIAKDIVVKAQAYNDNYYDGIVRSFQGAGYSKEYINNLIWGTYTCDNQLDKRPFSKLIKDILEQIGMV